MKLLTFILSMFLSMCANAQMDSLLYERSYEIDSLRTGELNVEIDNVTFFKDNEYDGCLVTGYTLPGLWLQPKMSYQPLHNLHLELGMHTLLYAGKLKYPNVGYQDIGTWKGEDYMKGTHLLPFFRANLQLNQVHLVLGNLYGGQNHHLIEPLYSRELNMTNDPEMGFQLFADLKYWHFDAWVNWQSFIFRGDTHQESFIFGAVSELKTGKWTFPVQAVVQHRGGEIQVDSAHHGVQTLINTAAGARYEQPVHTNWLTKITAEVEGTYYLQQSGTLYSVDKGWGIYARTLFDFKPGIRLDLNYFHGKDYVPVLGDGHYCCFNTSMSASYSYTNIANAAVEYSRTFSKHYTFGARAEMYAQGVEKSCKFDFNFGVFLKCNPHFLIKKFR